MSVSGTSAGIDIQRKRRTNGAPNEVSGWLDDEDGSLKVRNLTPPTRLEATTDITLGEWPWIGMAAQLHPDGPAALVWVFDRAYHTIFVPGHYPVGTGVTFYSDFDAGFGKDFSSNVIPGPGNRATMSQTVEIPAGVDAITIRIDVHLRAWIGNNGGRDHQASLQFCEYNWDPYPDCPIVHPYELKPLGHIRIRENRRWYRDR